MRILQNLKILQCNIWYLASKYRVKYSQYDSNLALSAIKKNKPENAVRSNLKSPQGMLLDGNAASA